MINDNPYFVGKDVAGILGYERGSKAIVDHTDEEERKMLDSKLSPKLGLS